MANAFFQQPLKPRPFKALTNRSSIFKDRTAEQLPRFQPLCVETLSL